MTRRIVLSSVMSNAAMTDAQAECQHHRETNGKYGKVNPCYRCGKSAGATYYSAPHTDQYYHDIGLVLCKKCAEKCEAMAFEDQVRFLATGMRWAKMGTAWIERTVKEAIEKKSAG